MNELVLRSNMKRLKNIFLAQPRVSKQDVKFCPSNGKITVSKRVRNTVDMLNLKNWFIPVLDVDFLTPNALLLTSRLCCRMK